MPDPPPTSASVAPDPPSSPITTVEPEQARLLLASLTKALAGCAVLALLFTAVNTTLFAVRAGVPWPIAVLLDPMVALALATVLLADAKLAAYGLPPPAWSAVLRWFTGLAATVMNCWTSLFPTGQVHLPPHPDPAGLIIHATPPLLLILLTETVAAYRTRLAPHLHQPPHNHAPAPAPADSDDLGSAPGGAPQPQPDHEELLLTRARTLDTRARTATGQGVSIRALRRELHLGQDRARALHSRLSRDPHPHPESTCAPTDPSCSEESFRSGGIAGPAASLDRS